MIKIFTQTDLIRYLYQETSEEEKREIDKALTKDTELRTLFTELSSVKKELDASKAEPSNETVNKILSYSKNSRVQSH
jgi:anti-sigma factor RsiW